MKIIIKSYKYFPFIRLNTNCKQEEKQGTGPGSCSGGKVGNQESDAKDTVYIGFKASHNFDYKEKQDKKFNATVQAALDRAAEPLKKFSLEEKSALRAYTGSTFKTINDYLNSNENLNDAPDYIIEDAKKSVHEIDNLFSNAILKDNLIAFRGIKDDIIVKNPDLREALDSPGSEIEFKCFSSSSALPFQAARFAEGYNGRLLELKLPKGAKALFIAEESGIPNEFEILVNRGTKFKVGESKTEKIIPVNGRAFNMKVTTLEALV